MIFIRQTAESKDINRKLAVLDQASMYEHEEIRVSFDLTITSFSESFCFRELASHPWWRTQVAEYQLLLQKQRELQSVREYTMK